MDAICLGLASKRLLTMMTKLNPQLHFNINTPHSIKPGTLPTSITKLQLGDLFNQQLNKPNMIPSSLVTLKFGRNFNQPLVIDMLPTSITKLRFGESFNQPIPFGALPSSLLTLSFSYAFIQTIQPRSLPPSLTNLDFNRPRGGTINLTLTLVMPKFKQPLPLEIGTIPSSVHTLNLPRWYHPVQIHQDYLPASLKHLTINYDSVAKQRELGPDALPRTLETLKLGQSSSVIIITTTTPGSLPDTLVELDVGVHTSAPIQFDKLPLLRSLTLGQKYRHSVFVGTLGSSLTSLSIKNNHVLESFPMSLTSLVLGAEYFAPINPGALPSSLTTLELGNKFFYSLSNGVLPSSLRSLSLGSSYFHDTVLPDSLTHLTLSSFEQITKCLATASTSSTQSLDLKVVQSLQHPSSSSSSCPTHLQHMFRSITYKIKEKTSILLDKRPKDMIQTLIGMIPKATTYTIHSHQSLDNQPIFHIRTIDNMVPNIICIINNK
ncbi:hypothetical protein SAMD00019534_040080 [Acytostelium subglobosum LB1]|uniref:hypothetical protein n=1 Tax=Acytostelium subglobosum LB1 TaxID=1410327 RepID=UPI000644CE73|nr:hypothetical protein SAMD00019534_040080 [Acytostelium subglobosum LB1]GAM20833.1 hypothetical protein SAMD00019534_040080 [Acytostelium subglobosum LB1]|eukprot:XP_012755967.1 hypothetical protein SAMD00019534_040080 [Acytostelium subglobosum LB1]